MEIDRRLRRYIIVLLIMYCIGLHGSSSEIKESAGSNTNRSASDLLPTPPRNPEMAKKCLQDIQIDTLFRNRYLFDRYHKFRDEIEKSKEYPGYIKMKSKYPRTSIEECFKKTLNDKIVSNKQNSLNLDNNLTKETIDQHALYFTYKNNVDKIIRQEEDKVQKRIRRKQDSYINGRYIALEELPTRSNFFVRFLASNEINISTPESAGKIVTSVETLFHKYTFKTANIAFENYYGIVYQLVKKIDLFMAEEEQAIEKYKDTEGVDKLNSIFKKAMSRLKHLKKYCLDSKKDILAMYGIIKIQNKKPLLTINGHIKIEYDHMSCTHRNILINALENTLIFDIVRLMVQLNRYSEEIENIKKGIKKQKKVTETQYITKIQEQICYNCTILFKKINILALQKDRKDKKEIERDIENIVKQIKKVEKKDIEMVKIECILEERLSKCIETDSIIELVNNTSIKYYPTEMILNIHKNHTLHEERISKIDIKKRKNLETIEKIKNIDISSIYKIIKHTIKKIDKHIKKAEKSHISLDILYEIIKFRNNHLTKLIPLLQKMESQPQSCSQDMPNYSNGLECFITKILPRYKKIIILLKHIGQYDGSLRHELFFIKRIRVDSIEKFFNSITQIVPKSK